MKIPTPRKLKSGTYFLQLRLGGESIPVTGKTKAECEKRAALIKSEYKNGLRKRKTDKESITLEAAIDSYIKKRQATKSPSTIVGYKNIKRNRFKAYMKTPLVEINWQEAIDKEYKAGSKDGAEVSPKTVKNAFGFIKSVYKENGLAVPEADLPAAVKADKNWLDSKQIPVFLAAVKGKKCEIPALLALHSLRKSEVCGLEWKDIDLSVPVIHVNGALLINDDKEWVKRDQNKTYDSNRYVPIFIPQLKDALEAVEDKTGRVVKCHPETPYRQIQKICRENNLPLTGWHGLRHSFASLCYSQGIGELDCMKLGGWSDYATMRKIYTHLSEVDRNKTIEKLSGFFKKC